MNPCDSKRPLLKAAPPSLAKKKRTKQTDPMERHNCLQQLLRRQTQNRWFNAHILFPKERVKIVFGILQESAEILEFGLETFYVSVHLFDSVISKFPIQKHQMQPLALVCLVLSSKLFEKRKKLANYHDVHNYILPYGVERFHQMERMVLLHLDFRPHIVSPFRLVQLLLSEFLAAEYNFFDHFGDSPENRKQVRLLALHLLLISILDYNFYKYTAHAVAVGVIMVLRRILGLPVWTEDMRSFSGLSLEKVLDCFASLEVKFFKNFSFIVFEQMDLEIREDFEKK